LLVALSSLDSLRDPGAVGGWLHRILRNTCFMSLRRANRSVSPVETVAPPAVPSAERVVEALALRDWLWSAVDALAPDDRVTVMLRYFSRCESYEAIAAVTGVPIGTVRSRLHRSRAQLGERLLRSGSRTTSHADRTQEELAEWEGFYSELHE